MVKATLASLVLISMLFQPLSSQAAPFSKKTFSNFSIVHADKLDFKTTTTDLAGDVQIRFGPYLVKSPKVIVNNDAKNSPEIINFLDGVSLESNDLSIEAHKIEVNFKDNMLKCYGAPDVISTWGNIAGEETEIVANYQEYDLQNGKARATMLSDSNQVSVTSTGRNILANEVNLQQDQSSGSSGLQTVDFVGNVVSQEKDKRIQGDQISIWVPGDTIKVLGNAKVLVYAEDNRPVYIFADMVLLEKEVDILSAMSDSVAKQAEIFSEDFKARGRQIFVQRINGKPDKAVITGEAFAQFKDKGIEGEEIMFDIKRKVLTSIVGRPTTKIFTASKAEEKPKKKRRHKRRFWIF